MSDIKKFSSNLRTYRFKKSERENQSSNSYQVPGRKRIQMMHDSESENENSPTRNQVNLTIEQKEALLTSTKIMEPTFQSLVIQDALVLNGWNQDKALLYLKNLTKKRRIDTQSKNSSSQSPQKSPKPSHTSSHSSHVSPRSSHTSPKSSHNSSKSSHSSPRVSSSHHTHASSHSSHSSSHSSHTSSHHHNYSNSSNNHHHHHHHSSSKHNGTHSNHHHRNGNGSSSHHHSSSKTKHKYDSDQDTGKPKERVFDSDEDSDDVSSVSTNMSADRKKVFDFMNESNDTELLSLKTCTSRKIEVIMELRPFKNWDDMVKKIKEHKQLNTEILNHCQNLLVRRHNLVAIMKKCSKIVDQLELAVSTGLSYISSQPKLLNEEMKLADYQMVGLNWLAILHRENTNGILADEMGLGKTIQVISFLAYLKESGHSKNPHLIVVPSSTLDNWDHELSKWCPSLVVAKYYGSADERRSLRIKWSKGGLKGIDVVLTTYHQLTSTPEERKMFRVTPLHYVIFDEAHMLKNMTTQRYGHLIRVNSDRRLLLTGTPLQNNLLELMSLLCFVMPSLFAGNKDDIKTLFEKKVKTKTDNAEETTKFEQFQIIQAKKIMKPFVLRRLKQDVLKYLPKKTNEVIKIKLMESQQQKYKELVHCYSSESGIVKATNELSGMSMMMDMRKLANHPLLMRYYYTDSDVRKMSKLLAKDSTFKGVNPDYIFDDLAILSDFKLYEMVQKYKSLKGLEIPNKLILESSKFKELDRLLPELKTEGHRVLIFSQFTMMLDILERYLTLRHHGYMRLDGNTPVTERQDLIDKFTTDCDYFVFLLSTKAGGLGINLTAADTVIIHDIDFNPYNDKQAEDRCHRMGQKNTVKIYKLITESTIEEGMFMVAQEKLNLEREVTNDGADEVKEYKCMVRLLTMSLGMDSSRAENMLSPKIIKKTRLNDELEVAELEEEY